VTAERGARFHPTIGSVIPIGFSTSHPRAGPRCFETQYSTSHSLEVEDEGYSPSPLLMNHCIFRSSSGSPSAIPVTRAPYSPFHNYFLAFFCEVVCGMNFPVRWSSLRASMDGRFTPIPSFSLEEPPHLPSGRVIHSRV
jgi:hypothetical protein